LRHDHYFVPVLILAAALSAQAASAQIVARLPDPATADAGGADLVTSYRSARAYDPQFRAAGADRQVNLATASQALTQYLPTAQYQMTSVPNENTTRQIVSVTQPIISVDRYAVLRQRGPRKAYAEATFGVADQNLATRLLTEVCNYIKAVESSRLNNAKIEALGKQSERSEKLYKNGLGTITDARDIQVRYEQALANKIILESEQRAAAARVASITGVKVKPGDFAFPDHPGRIQLDSLSTYQDTQESGNPSIAQARASERVGKLEALKAKGSLLPTVGVSAVYTKSQGVSDNYVGLSIQAPLAPSGLFAIRSANAAAQKTTEARRQTEETARVDLERLYDLVDGGQKALDVSASAIKSAELSVEANTKSYEGGVRTNVDVVNAIQTVFEVKNAYITSATQLAQNLLTLLLLSGQDSDSALATTQRFLFAR
jgi:outer membrane protein TolC